MKKCIFLLVFLLFTSSFALDDQEVPESKTIDFDGDRVSLENLKNIVKKVDKDSKVIAFNLTLVERYKMISEDWREIYKIQHDGVELHIDDISSFKDLSEEQKVIVNKLKEEKEQLLSYIERLFHTVSKRRSITIKQLFNSKQHSMLKFDELFLLDLTLEVKTIPLRWISLFKSRYLKVKSDLLEGIDGWLRIIKEVIAAFVVFILGFIFYRLFKKFSLYLEQVRIDLSKKSYRDSKARLTSKWLGRISPLLPWIWLVVFFELSEKIIAGGYFRELIILFPYFTYYAYYRVFRIVIKQVISSYSFYKYDQSFRIDKRKLDWTSKFLGQVLLLVLIVKHSLASAGGEGFLYNWISSVFYYLFIFLVFLVSAKWRDEISLVAQKSFSGSLLSIVNKGLSGKLRFFFCFPILLLEALFQCVYALYGFLERFDLVRAISAQYFRKKVITTQQGNVEPNIKTGPSIEYLEGFHSPQCLSLPLENSQQVVHDSIMKNVDDWINEKSDEHIALIYGEKGIGKTFLLRRIEENIEDTEKLYYELEDRNTLKEQLNQIVSELRPKNSKIVVFIDGLQYMFLSKKKGFEHFKEFLKMTQEENLENVFWCLGINNYSWEFIESVLNKSRYFNFIYNINRWREEDIQNLIIKKHQNTGFNLSYDEVLYNSNRGPENDDFDIEGRYFRILWEEAMGNPSIAQMIWIASIEKCASNKVKAFIPIERSEFLAELPDDFYFVLASIVRHDSLNINEILESTNLSEDIVRNSVKNCLEKGYLTKKKNSKVSISLLSQHSIYSSLRRMNFIYG